MNTANLSWMLHPPTHSWSSVIVGAVVVVVSASSLWRTSRTYSIVCDIIIAGKEGNHGETNGRSVGT